MNYKSNVTYNFISSSVWLQQAHERLHRLLHLCLLLKHSHKFALETNTDLWGSKNNIFTYVVTAAALSWTLEQEVSQIDSNRWSPIQSNFLFSSCGLDAMMVSCCPPQFDSIVFASTALDDIQNFYNTLKLESNTYLYSRIISLKYKQKAVSPGCEKSYMRTRLKLFSALFPKGSIICQDRVQIYLPLCWIWHFQG